MPSKIWNMCLYPAKKIAKRVKKRHPAKQVKKRDDPFTRLTDELIMSHILSRFTLEERARLCVLSRRWKRLWDGSNIGAKLVFTPDHLTPTAAAINSPPESMLSLVRARQIRMNRIRRLKSSYIRWISNVVQASYDALPKLNELTVRYPFDSSDGKEIDMWLECGFKRGVTRLVLDQHYGLDDVRNNYCFPKIDKFRGMLSNCVYYNLRDVELRRMFVTDEVIECMRAHFPLLERLCITQRYERIGKLSITSGDNRLKSLELSQCDHLTISASNLTSFTYAGTEDSVLFQHVPNLSELSVDDVFSSTFLHTGFLNAGGYITQLKRLQVAMSHKDFCDSVHYPTDFHYTLCNLEELKIKIEAYTHVSILWPIFLIQAAPFLRKFSAEVFTVNFYSRMSPQQPIDPARRMRDTAMTLWNRHQHLKTIEFHGYQGHFNNNELVRHLLKVSDVLEEFIIAPLPLGELKHPPLRNRAKAQDMVNRLDPIFKTQAKLIIL